MWTVCQVARWIPPGHYRFRRRANSEMESVPVISAQTHSAWWAQMRVSKASHVWNEGGGIQELNQMKRGIQIRECGHPHRSCLWASGWWHRRLNTLKIHQQHLKWCVRFKKYNVWMWYNIYIQHIIENIFFFLKHFFNCGLLTLICIHSFMQFVFPSAAVGLQYYR